MKTSLYAKKIWGLKDYSIDDIVSNYVKAEKHTDCIVNPLLKLCRRYSCLMLQCLNVMR